MLMVTRSKPTTSIISCKETSHAPSGILSFSPLLNLYTLCNNFMCFSMNVPLYTCTLLQNRNGQLNFCQYLCSTVQLGKPLLNNDQFMEQLFKVCVYICVECRCIACTHYGKIHVDRATECDFVKICMFVMTGLPASWRDFLSY